MPDYQCKGRCHTYIINFRLSQPHDQFTFRHTTIISNTNLVLTGFWPTRYSCLTKAPDARLGCPQPHWPADSLYIYMLCMNHRCTHNVTYDNLTLLLHKLNDLDLPDFVYNWLVSFLIGHSQTCIVDGVCSPVVDITSVLFKDLA